MGYDHGSKKELFCYKMYHTWTYRDLPLDIPILIMNDENLIKNRDVEIIPRLYAKYASQNVKIPLFFSTSSNQYESLNEYFFQYCGKVIPSLSEFKKMVLEKRDIEEHESLYESLNLFLYTSFLLRQFAPVMKIIPHFYSPIRDETKYYFYLCVDYLRRMSLDENKPLMKSTILHIISQLGILDGQVLSKEIFQKSFDFLKDDFFESHDLSLFFQYKPFSFMVKENRLE